VWRDWEAFTVALNRIQSTVSSSLLFPSLFGLYLLRFEFAVSLYDIIVAALLRRWYVYQTFSLCTIYDA